MTGITNPAEIYFKDGAWGWDGNCWCKLPLLWGYTDQYAEVVYSLNMPAGTSNLNGTAVPAGQVWHVNGGSIQVASASCSTVSLGFQAGATTIYVGQRVAPATGTLYTFPCNAVLKAGDYMVSRFLGMTLGDDAYAWLWGYKMAVT